MDGTVDIRMPGYVSEILEKLNIAGYEAYVVGGCVRDSLMEREPQDWDVCTSALPGQTAEVFRDRKTLTIGMKHGTVTVVCPDGNVEITTYRTEGAYSDGRHPDSVDFVRDLREDLARRDFTINSMAWSPEDGLVDPFGGRKDIDGWMLRAVGDPVERFREDGLRIMRAVRFMSTLGFRADDPLRKALLSEKELLKDISAERVRTELMKLLAGPAAAEILNEYREVIAVIIPEAAAMFGYDQHSPYHNRDVWHHTLAAVDDIPRTEPELRMVMLLHDIAKPVIGVIDENGRGHFMGHQRVGADIADEILRRLKFSGKEISRMTELIRVHDAKVMPEKASVRKWLGILGEEQLERLLLIKHADASGKYPVSLEEAERRNAGIRELKAEILRDHDCITVGQLALKGSDLQRAGIASGPEIGSMLEKLLDLVIRDEVMNYSDRLMEAAERLARQKDRYIIFSGAPECYVPEGLDFRDAVVIACDSGYRHAVAAGAEPDIVLGDFDSYSGDVAEGPEILRLPAEKDDTDTQYAVRLAMDRGAADITILGALGGRLDHGFANIQSCVAAARKKIMCRMVDEHHEVFALHCSGTRVLRGKWKWLSVFAVDREIAGVTLRGLKYETENERLYNFFPRGASNEFTDESAELDVANGTMLVILSDME